MYERDSQSRSFLNKYRCPSPDSYIRDEISVGVEVESVEGVTRVWLLLKTLLISCGGNGCVMVWVFVVIRIGWALPGFVGGLTGLFGEFISNGGLMGVLLLPPIGFIMLSISCMFWRYNRLSYDMSVAVDMSLRF